jgi:hypothetical protein
MLKRKKTMTRGLKQVLVTATSLVVYDKLKLIRALMTGLIVSTGIVGVERSEAKFESILA